MHTNAPALSRKENIVSISAPIGVLVVDDHDSLRSSIVRTLNSETDIIVVGEGRNGIEAIEQVSVLAPDVVVMDIVMPSMDGLAAIEKIRNINGSSKVLIISNYDEEPYVRSCMKEGASGYILKDALTSDLAAAIRVVHKGGHFFTQQIAQRIVGLYLQQVTSIEQR